jgi:hypothetical protein
MALFLELYLGHLIGDFLFQPGRLVIAKRDGVPGLLLHTLVVGLATIAVVIGSVAIDWAPAVLVTGLHLVIERITIATYLKTPTRGLFTLLMDQAMHALSIALVVWISGRWSFTAGGAAFGVPLSAVQLAKVCALATVMLFGSILVFEMGNAVLGEQKGRVLRLDRGRVYGIVERGAALALALVHPALMLVPFVPRLVWALSRGSGDRERQLLEGATGLGVCIAGYAGIAAVAYLVHGPAGALELTWTAGWLSAGTVRPF